MIPCPYPCLRGRSLIVALVVLVPMATMTAVADQADVGQGIDLSLRDAALREVLESLAAHGGVEIELAEGVAGSVSVHFEGVPWPLALDEICELHDCRVSWDGEPLRIVPTAERSRRRVDMKLHDIARARVLAMVDEADIWGPFAPLVIEGAELLRGKVSVDFEHADWAEVLDTLCHLPECTWTLAYGSPSRLRFEPGDPSVSLAGTVPTRPIEGLDLEARLSVEGHETMVTALRFAWASPLAIIRRGEVWVYLSWLPFGPERQVVLPILMSCRPGEELPRPGEIFEVGKKTTEASRWPGVVLELTRTESTVGARGTAATAPCRETGSGRVVTGLFDAEGKALGRPVSLALPSRLGTYLLIAPPGRGASPAAALLNLGGDTKGQHLALLVPQPGGGYSMEKLVLLPEAPMDRNLPREGGELTLEIVHRP